MAVFAETCQSDKQCVPKTRFHRVSLSMRSRGIVSRRGCEEKIPFPTAIKPVMTTGDRILGEIPLPARHLPGIAGGINR
jgi:hypothetical protein